MSFDNDVFFSYAHLDNQSFIEGQPGWISSFERALKIRLGQLLGREARIWRDPKLQGNDFFGDTLDSIRRFDPLNQRTTDKAERVRLHPVGNISTRLPRTANSPVSIT